MVYKVGSMSTSGRIGSGNFPETRRSRRPTLTNRTTFYNTPMSYNNSRKNYSKATGPITLSRSAST